MSELIRGFIQRNFTFLVGQHQQHLLLRELHCNKQNDENHEMFFTYHFESVTKLSSGEINLFNFNETALKHSLSPKNNCEFKAVHRGDGGDMSPTAAHKQRNQTYLFNKRIKWPNDTDVMLSYMVPSPRSTQPL